MTYYFTSLFKKSDVRITQGYSTTHKALDLSRGVVKQPIYSPNKLGSGTVTKVATSYVSGGVTYKNTLVVGIKYDNGMYIEMYHGEVADKVVSVGQRVVVGQQIYRTGNTGHSFGDHLHIMLKNSSNTAINPFDWFMNDNVPVPAFKVGDKVVFTGIQNIRIGAGDKFKISRATKVGEIATIKDGPRKSQNTQFGLGANDTYTWWDMVFTNGTGWVADVSKFKKYVEPIVEPVVEVPIPPVEPSVCPSCEELAGEVSKLNGKITAFKDEVRLLKERNTFLESTMAIRDTENIDLERELNKVREERDRFEKQYIDVVAELNELKKGRDDWINKIADALHKLFGMK